MVKTKILALLHVEAVRYLVHKSLQGLQLVLQLEHFVGLLMLFELFSFLVPCGVGGNGLKVQL